MPLSALDRLGHLNIEYPMLFQMKNPSTERVTHCGVLEFVADEGFIHMPNWLMVHLGVLENEIVRVRSTSLPKAGRVGVDRRRPRCGVRWMSWHNTAPCVFGGSSGGGFEPGAREKLMP